MLKIPSKYRLPLGIAIVLHLILLITLMIHLPKTASYRMKQAASTIKIVKAVTVNQQQVDQQIKKIKQRDREKRAAELARVDKLRREALAAKRKRIAEQERVVKLKADQLRLEKERVVQTLRLKKLRDQKAQEKAVAMKKWQEKQLQEKRALAERQQQLQQKLLQQQMVQEQKQIEKVRAVQMKGILDQYKAQIIQAIQSQWIVPDNVNQGLACVLLIKLAPGGVVLSVKTLTSSSDSVLDRSARVAVFKASPLPVPKNSAVFENFRELRLTVRPEQINNQ